MYLSIVVRVHPVRVSNPVSAVGDAHQQRSRGVHGALPLPAHARLVGALRQHPAARSTAAGVHREGRAADRTVEPGKMSTRY